MREYAAREGYEVLEEVMDPGYSGASIERPGMDRVRDLVATSCVSVVLGQDRDRFAREPAYHYLLRKEFEEQGTKIKALNDRGDDSPEGELTDGILDQLAKYERAKTAERTRRGRLKKAREGKILANNCADYGFRYNATKDGYLVDEETMPVVRRIFQMVAVEGVSIRGAAETLNREVVKPPLAPWSRSGRWGTTAIRDCIILDDVYKPHTYDEIKALVAPGVSAQLDPSKLYGVWWYNRTRSNTKQISVTGENGKEYKKRVTHTPRPREEWLAVPVPDSGVPRDQVDTAREAIKDNRKTSNAGRRFWELSGGIVRCGECGSAMVVHTTHRAGRPMYFYYVCPAPYTRWGDCSNSKHISAAKLETRVWEAVSGILKNPKQLRADLDTMIEMERSYTHGDPAKETKLWADKLTEVDRKRVRYQEMAAEGLITFDELRARLAELDATRKTAERELSALHSRHEYIKELEQDRDALLDSLIEVAPEALDSLTPEECHRAYKMLRLKVNANPDGSLEASGVFGEGLSFVKDTQYPMTLAAETEAACRPARRRRKG